MENNIVIPFGGESPRLDNVSQIDSWVLEEDKVPLLLAVSLYGAPVLAVNSYTIVMELLGNRTGAWIDSETNICVIGCKGTDPTSLIDLKDDKVSYLFNTILYNSAMALQRPS